jgi:LmbE family N-acetylglucosaminyl deacetylase
VSLEAFPDGWSRALCVVAHPDDLEYGASGAVAAWTAAGRTVAYLLATRGEAGIDAVPPEQAGPLREREQREAAAEVGVEVVEFLDHRDGVLEHTVTLRRDIAAVVRRHRPEVVVTLNFADRWGGNGPVNSADHRNLGRAVLDAVGDAGNRWIHTELGLDPWSGVRWVAVAGSSTPTHAVALSEDDFERAVRSLDAHAEYLRGLGPGPMGDARSFLERQARADDGSLRTAFELIPYG